MRPARHQEAAALLEKSARRADRPPRRFIERIKLALESGNIADALVMAEAAVESLSEHADLGRRRSVRRLRAAPRRRPRERGAMASAGVLKTLARHTVLVAVISGLALPSGLWKA